MSQKPITFSNLLNSTLRLHLLGAIFTGNHEYAIPGAPHEKFLIITDKDEDITLMRKFAKILIRQEIHIIQDLGDLWKFSGDSSGIYCLSKNILEYGGTIEFLQRQTSIVFSRGIGMTMDEAIHLLIDNGYTHTDYRGELSTYKREGSTISITDRHGTLFQIEWFDTEIDSILESSSGGRYFREYIRLDSLHTDTDKLKRTPGVLNEDILTYISESTASTPIIIGCDFLEYIDILQKFAYIHFSDFQRSGAIYIESRYPKVQHIDELLEYIRAMSEDNHTCRIVTKFSKSVLDFLQLHNIQSISVEEVQKSGLESFELIQTKGKRSHTEYMICDDIIGEVFVRERTRKKSLIKNLDLLISLKPGDYVVHREHGIARFEKVIKKSLGNLEREYLELHYAEGDKLFVPLTEIYRVSKYLGENHPELTRLSGKEWEKILEKTDEEIQEIAEDIIETTARRSIAKGRAFGIFRHEESLFQTAFKYEYTLDQKTAIDEIFEDMEKPEPMDRLLSGDVGFGKTEVAMNAIYKAVLSGTQVAVISPLLVLADEHYETFIDRLGAWGVRIGILTRMSSPSEVQTTLAKLKSGDIDVLVGTHRLLSDDIFWKKLGLLIIDEEHKFGVTHKEKIKKIRANIDILTLSATPIPRSLNLALSGLRKISLLTTPPRLKKPIKTIIAKWHEGTIAHAIEHELERGGQIIILHNRIRGMESIEKEIEDIVKNYRKLDPKEENGKVKSSIQQPKIIITHGQMPGEQIEDRIHAFKKGEYNILLTTTIIENGVNFLSANTIIIIDPEEFGLASLHQLRGRVGRKDEEGYCYLMYRKPELNSDEKERLITLANNSHLGAGFEIAMRDLEIRGAGDVLGIKQSGKSKDVGLTLYFRMLEEKIEVLKNEKKVQLPVKIELDISFIIPDELFLSEQDKLQFFRDIESIETLEELEEIEQDFSKDTSGGSYHNLFLLLKTRLILREYGVIKVTKVGVNYVFDFREDIDPPRIKGFLERFDKKNAMVLLSIKKIRVETRFWKSTEAFLQDIVTG